jgi:hypothetical protein
MTALPTPFIAGLDGSFVKEGLILMAVAVAIHVPIAGAVGFGHWALWKRKRRVHLSYVLPLTWYFIGLVAYWFSMVWYPDFAKAEWWPLGRHPDEESTYLAGLISLLLVLLHGTLIVRLLYRPGEPALSLLALWSNAWVLLLPPVGLISGVVALRRIRRNPSWLSGKWLAWAAIVVNSLGTLWVLLIGAAWLFGW